MSGSPTATATIANRAALGGSLPKRDNRALVTGRARYTGDMVRGRLLHGKLVRSPFAHARVLSVDSSEARAHPGVLDVIVPDDVRDLPRFSQAHIKDMTALAQEFDYDIFIIDQKTRGLEPESSN